MTSRSIWWQRDILSDNMRDRVKSSQTWLQFDTLGEGVQTKMAESVTFSALGEGLGASVGGHTP